MRWSIISIFSLCIAINLYTSDVMATASTPRATDIRSVQNSQGAQTGDLVFQENLFDFGRVVRGQTVTHEFRFTNTGKQSLRIQGFHAACGCTIVEVDQERQYAPGESGSLKIAIDTTNFTGSLVKTVTIMTNEALLPERILTMRVVVDEEFVVDPPIIDFGEIFAQDNPVRVVNISAVRDPKTELLSVTNSNKGLKAKIIPPNGNESWRISVQLKPGQNPGIFKDTLIVKNTSKFLPTLQILVRAQIRKQISTSPEYLEFGAIPKKQKMERSVNLMSRVPFVVSSPKVELLVNGEPVSDPSKLVQFEVRNKDQTNQQVMIKILNDSERTGTVHGKIKLQTNDNVQKNVELNFYAFFLNKEDGK